MRSAGPDLLGLALMDARNRTLGWLTAFEGLRWAGELAGFDPPGWLAGQAGWFQERWIARFVQRARGAAADPGVPRLPSLEPRADAWFDPDASTRSQRWLAGALPAPAELQGYLAASLETTLALLDKAQPDDAGLHVFRLALMHEDRVGETLATLVQALDLSPERCQPLAARGLWPDLPSRSRRDAMWLPGQTVRLGAAPCGFSPDAETPAREVQVPEFEIDAQPVTWAQFVEFAGDGGYDDPRWWTPAGRDWLETSQRRAPRYVEQMGGGVLARRLGRLQRLPLAQGVVHVSAHEVRPGASGPGGACPPRRNGRWRPWWRARAALPGVMCWSGWGRAPKPLQALATARWAWAVWTPCRRLAARRGGCCGAPRPGAARACATCRRGVLQRLNATSCLSGFAAARFELTAALAARPIFRPGLRAPPNAPARSRRSRPAWP